MNDEQHFLANAYLDGELTADERRIAEADPEVTTEVDRLRALQAELRDVPPPTSAARESAISTAMAAFAGSVGDEPADEPAGPRPTAAPVVPFRPRPAYAKYLGIAAAFVAVAGLGIVVAQYGSGGDDDSSGSAAEVLDDAAVERDVPLTESLDTADAADSEIMVAEDGAEETTEMAADEGFATEPVAESTAEATGEDTAQATAGGTPEADRRVRDVPADFDPQAPITDDVELGIYGAYLIAERDAGRLPPTPNHACDDAQQILDEATLLLDDDPVPVYIDLGEADGRVAALRTDTCAELLLGSLYAD